MALFADEDEPAVAELAMDGEGPLLYPPVRARLDEGMDSGEDWDERARWALLVLLAATQRDGAEAVTTREPLRS